MSLWACLAPMDRSSKPVKERMRVMAHGTVMRHSLSAVFGGPGVVCAFSAFKGTIGGEDWCE